MSRTSLKLAPILSLLFGSPALADHPAPMPEPFDTEPAWIALESEAGCLTALEGRAAVTACEGGPAQVWSLQAEHLVNGEGLCLAMPRGRRGLRGARLRVEGCQEVSRQRFGFADSALVTRGGLCLEADDRGRLRAEPCDDAPSQAWRDLDPEEVLAGGLEAAPAEDLPEGYPPVEAAVIVNGPANIYVPPAPAPPSPLELVDAAFDAVHHSLHTFRHLVDLFAPGALTSTRW